MRHPQILKMMPIPCLAFALCGVSCQSGDILTKNESLPITKVSETPVPPPFEASRAGAFFGDVNRVGVFLTGPSDVMVLSFEIPESEGPEFEVEISSEKDSRGGLIHFSGDKIGQYKSPGLSVVPPMPPDYEHTERSAISGTIICDCKNLPVGFSDMSLEKSAIVSLKNIRFADGETFDMGPLEFRFVIMPP